jgi:hypothetical protein
MAVPIEDCCGLGCNNCILDRFIDSCTRRPLTSQSLHNLFNQSRYQNFRVRGMTKVRDLVYQFNFELVCECREGFKKDEQLWAPPVSYLMMRARRELPENFNEFFSDFKEFWRENDDDNRVSSFSTQRHDKGTPEIYFSRKYTPYEVNEQLRTFRIMVKLEPFGFMSRFLTTLRVGDVCEFKGPFEAFSYTHEAIENYIVITQGALRMLLTRSFLSILFDFQAFRSCLRSA